MKTHIETNVLHVETMYFKIDVTFDNFGNLTYHFYEKCSGERWKRVVDTKLMKIFK